MESRIPVEILGILRRVARDSDLVISSIPCLVGRGGGCGVARFLAEDGSRNLDFEFLKQLGGCTDDCLPPKGSNWWTRLSLRPEDGDYTAIGAVSYCSFAYSALACLRMGMSGSASFHSARK